MGSFEAATVVEAAAPGEYKVVLDAQWAVGTKIHGGYLFAVIARAAGEISDHPHLTAISGSFPGGSEPGPATVEVEVLRASRSVTQLRGRLIQGGVPCVEALITQGTLPTDDSWWSGLPLPELPAEQDCRRMLGELPRTGINLPLLDVVETRFDAQVLAGLETGQPAKQGAIVTLQRLADGSDWDPLSLLVALDPAPPVTYDLGAPGWAPTLQMSAYIRRLPAPGSIAVRMNANEVGGGRMDETAFAWDSTGRLVAQATQFAAVRVPD